MPNTDIRIAVSFRDHRKRRKLLELLGPAGVLALIDLWLFAAENRPEGNFKGMTAAEIADEARWTGDPKKLIDALLTVGFVKRRNKVLEIHDWNIHNYYASKAHQRQWAARKGAHHKWLKDRGIKCSVRKCEFCGRNARASAGASARASAGAGAGAGAGAYAGADALLPTNNTNTLTTRGREVEGSGREGKPGATAGPETGPGETVEVWIEAVRSWNLRAAEFGAPTLEAVQADALSERIEEVTAAIVKLRPEFVWSQCIERISASSWLVREADNFSFEWLLKREAQGIEWNAVKVWDGKLGADSKSKKGSFEDIFDEHGRPRKGAIVE